MSYPGKWCKIFIFLGETCSGYHMEDLKLVTYIVDSIQCRKRRMKVVVVDVPKTIDNDIMLMDKTSGFDTVVEEAQRAINSAYIEAHSAYHGIGIVKLMGCSSGFIAMQDFLEKTNAKDASGNAVLGDIGVYLQQEVIGWPALPLRDFAGYLLAIHMNIKKYFKEMGETSDVKYIDPTCMIHPCRANASDGILCTVLGQNAVHGAFAGYSGITVVYAIPIMSTFQSQKSSLNPGLWSRMWHCCLTSTGQPDFLLSRDNLYSRNLSQCKIEKQGAKLRSFMALPVPFI